MGEFRELLKSVTHNKQIYKVEHYWDAQNVPGAEWDPNIKWRLKEADVIVFFVTPNFLESDYIVAQEIPIALERMENSRVHILPILIDHCDFEKSQLGHLQFIPVLKNRIKPLSEWKNKKEFRELVRFALKLSIKNAIVGHPHALQFHPDVLTPVERNRYIDLFVSPEIARLAKKATRKKKAKTKDTLLGKMKKTLKMWLKF